MYAEEDSIDSPEDTCNYKKKNPSRFRVFIEKKKAYSNNCNRKYQRQQQPSHQEHIAGWVQYYCKCLHNVWAVRIVLHSSIEICIYHFALQKLYEL